MHRKMEVALEWQRQPIAANTQHPMPDRVFLPCLPLATQQWEEAEDDLGGSTSELFGSHYQHSQESKRESVVAPSAHATKQLINSGRKVVCLRTFLLCSDAGLTRPSQARGLRCLWGHGMRTSPYAPPSRKTSKRVLTIL